EASSFSNLTVIATCDAEYRGALFKILPLLKHHKLTPRGLLCSLVAIGRMKRDTLVHAADVRAGFVALCARLLLGRRYIVMIHGSDVAKFDRFSLSKLAAMTVY